METEQLSNDSINHFIGQILKGEEKMKIKLRKRQCYGYWNSIKRNALRNKFDTPNKMSPSSGHCSSSIEQSTWTLYHLINKVRTKVRTRTIILVSFYHIYLCTLLFLTAGVSKPFPGSHIVSVENERWPVTEATDPNIQKLWVTKKPPIFLESLRFWSSEAHFSKVRRCWVRCNFSTNNTHICL